ncbi:MAG: response regulator [bacterium]
MKKSTELIEVWVIEDNPEYRRTLDALINRAADMKCARQFVACEEAISALSTESPPQVILLDIGLPGMSGVEGVQHFKAVSPSSQIIMLTVYEDDDNIFKSICAGASGYLVKRLSGGKILEAIRDTITGGAPMNAPIARKVLNMFARFVKPTSDYDLTKREKEILDLLVAGETQKMIAGCLNLSAHTIGTHIKNIYVKLQVHSRGEVVAKALRENLI